MPVHNIEDCRTNDFDARVHVVFEPCWHDNNLNKEFADRNELSGVKKWPTNETDFDVYLIALTTIDLAIRFAATQWPTLPVRMFLYDPIIGFDMGCSCDTHALYEENGKVLAKPYILPNGSRDARALTALDLAINIFTSTLTRFSTSVYHHIQRYN